MLRRFAARVKFSSSASVTKYRRWRNSIWAIEGPVDCVRKHRQAPASRAGACPRTIEYTDYISKCTRFIYGRLVSRDGVQRLVQLEARTGHGNLDQNHEEPSGDDRETMHPRLASHSGHDCRSA